VEAHGLILLRHFLVHYASLGIRLPTHAHICLQGDEATAQFAYPVLREFGVTNVSLAPEYSSKLKLGLVNQFIRLLPADAFMVYPDADEMFHFPNSSVLAPLIEDRSGYTLTICGDMLDRIASDFTLPPLRLTPSLDEQFPVCANVRKSIQSSVKITLIRSRFDGELVQFHNSHAAQARIPNSTKLRTFGTIGAVNCIRASWLSHYQFSDEAYGLVLRKLNIYSNTSSKLQDRNNANVYRRELRLFFKDATTGVARFTDKGMQTVRKQQQRCHDPAKAGRIGQPSARLNGECHLRHGHGKRRSSD